ncbi:Zinc finger and BTB domain-containing protein 24 [Daldinia childiae]|uniref:Zinc finger and BTB domain-containing protein 24 n=1 Tax=Daldinia childiae TaxID=326645 RepID=UPI001444C473|nr:Zinc finger and BTB domain-containing protein 24 [Daldinia childiae]KAF3064187.1 Zinc finger and BTB domain-containing protein 24 [Daldinia childiae]
MSSRCVICDRSFDSDESLQQHRQAAPAHTFDCRSCDRHYGSKQALQQHLRDSPVHAPSFKCKACDRSFSNEQALQQHLRDSPVHTTSFDCDDCNRSFDSEEALQQHLRDSPAHALTFACETCSRSFGDEPALQQHLRNSPIHAPSFDCETCNRSFGSKEALDQHLRDSSIHQKDTETPLDVFFRSFPEFDYDPSLPPATSYANLQRQEGWSRGNPASDDAWNRYQDALQSELHLWYGAEDDLNAWHALCRPIGIEPLPKTCEQCEEVGDLATKIGGFMLTRVNRLHEGHTLISLI